MILCPYCEKAEFQTLEAYQDHIAHNPPRGCDQVAVALDRHWWPYKLEHDGHGQGGRRQQRTSKDKSW